MKKNYGYCGRDEIDLYDPVSYKLVAGCNFTPLTINLCTFPIFLKVWALPWLELLRFF